MYYVDYTNGSDVTGDGSSGSPFKHFSKAYSVATNGDTIDLSGYFDWASDPSSNAVTGLDINKSITIQGHTGALARIDCCGDRRAFTFGSYNISLSNVEIFNGWNANQPSYRSPAIDMGNMSTNSNAYLYNCWIHDCCTSRTGSLNTNLCIIRNGNYSNVVCENVTVNACNVNYMIVYTGYGSNITLKNCTFTDNSCGYYTIYSNAGPGILNMINCTVYNNEDTALRMQSGTMNLKNTILYNRDANTSIDYTGGTFAPYNNLVKNTGSLPVTNGVSGNVVATTSAFSSVAQNGSIYGIPTVALTAGNPAINAGDIGDFADLSMARYDQRGFLRDTSNYDIGSYAYTAYAPPTVTLSGSSSVSLIVNEAMTPITFTVTNASAESWQITPDLPAGLSLDPSSGSITGTPTTIDLYTTSYTVSGGNQYGSGTATVNLKITDSYLSTLDANTGYTAASLTSINALTVSGTDLLDISSYMPDSSNTRRRNLIDTILSRSQNSSKNYFRATRSDLKLSTDYTRDVIRVYRKGLTIDLNDLSGDEGAYCTINASGEFCTFLNVGGNGNTAAFTAGGDGTYDITYNGVDIGTGSDGEEIAVGGVAFYFGSVGTEGTAGDTICFTGDALVLTDNGYVPIKDVTSGQTIVTICGSEVVQHAVRTLYAGDTLISIQRDALGPGVPNRDTAVTPEHKLRLSDGRFYYAKDLINFCGVSLVQSEQYQYVYNIATSSSTFMYVNGLIAETLDPRNINIQTRGKLVNLSSQNNPNHQNISY